MRAARPGPQQAVARLALVTPGCSRRLGCARPCVQVCTYTVAVSHSPGHRQVLLVQTWKTQSFRHCLLQCSVSVVKGQVSPGSQKADKWRPLRGGLHALAAQTSQPLTLVLSRSCGVLLESNTQIHQPSAPVCTSAFYTIASTHSESHPAGPGCLPEERPEI